MAFRRTFDRPSSGDDHRHELLREWRKLTLEATRRTVGWILPAICVGFLAYAYLGGLIPDSLGIAHKGYGPWLEDPDGNVFVEESWVPAENLEKVFEPLFSTKSRGGVLGGGGFRMGDARRATARARRPRRDRTPSADRSGAIRRTRLSRPALLTTKSALASSHRSHRERHERDAGQAEGPPKVPFRAVLPPGAGSTPP